MSPIVMLSHADDSSRQSISDVCFVHVPKAAGKSVIATVLGIGRGRVASCGPNFQSFRFPNVPFTITIIGHNARVPDYMTLQRHRSRTNHCFAVACVRNPYDRLLSAFYYLAKGGEHGYDRSDAQQYVLRYGEDFDRFVKDELDVETPGIFKQIHCRPQTDWLCGANGDLLTDMLCRYETLSEDLSVFASRIGVTLGNIPHLNAGPSRRREQSYSPATRSIVARAYRADFVRLGYST
jgi:hypothetical protein